MKSTGTLTVILLVNLFSISFFSLYFERSSVTHAEKLASSSTFGTSLSLNIIVVRIPSITEYEPICTPSFDIGLSYTLLAIFILSGSLYVNEASSPEAMIALTVSMSNVISIAICVVVPCFVESLGSSGSLYILWLVLLEPYTLPSAP